MVRINLTYSEDLRENKVSGKVYGLLRDDFHIDPIFVNQEYSVETGTSNVLYQFSDSTSLPERQTLEAKLKDAGVTFTKLQLWDGWGIL